MNEQNEDGVQPVELGPRVAERVAAFEASYVGGCGHEDADQWAAAGSVRSACIACMRVAGPLAAWERPGPCDLCGRLLTEPATTSWAVPSKTTGVIAVLRMCGACVAEEVLALGEPRTEGEPMTDQTRLPMRQWMSLAAGALPDKASAWEQATTATCKACATSWVDAAEGRRELDSLKLHTDCADSLRLVARASARAATRAGGQQLATAIRGRVAVLRSEVAA